MTIEQIITKAEETLSIIQAVADADIDSIYTPALQLAHDTLQDAIENLTPYIKQIDLK